MELTCGLRDGVSGNGTGKRHMVMGTAKLEASWLSFLPVRDRMLLRGRVGEGGEQGKKRDNKDTKKQHITLKWLYRDSVSRKEPKPDIPHIGCSVSRLLDVPESSMHLKFGFGSNRNSSSHQTGAWQIRTDHCISCVSGDKEQNYKKWHVFSGSPVLRL